MTRIQKVLLRPSLFPPVDNRRASILILALWTVCFLSVLAVILGYGARQKAMVMRRLEQIDKLSLIAEAGAEKAVSELLKMAQDRTYLGLSGTPCNNPAAFQNVPVGEGSFSVYYTYFDEESGSQQTLYGVRDEESKININQAELPVLRRLFQIVLGYEESQAEELAAAIIDWRDSDSLSASPAVSAEDSHYHNLPFPYEAKDALFETPDELLLVEGFSPEVFDRLRDYIAIYGSGKVNINTTSKPVLLALGLSSALVDKIIAWRKGQDRIIATADDNIFKLTSDIVYKLKEYYNISVAETEELNAAIEQYLATDSSVFTIRSLASLNRQKNSAEVACAVNREGKILYWHEN